MNIGILTTPQEFADYNTWITSHPQGSLWQSLEYKNYMEALGRKVRMYAAKDGDAIIGSALVVIDRTAFGLSVWEIPRGPVWNLESGIWNPESFINRIADDAKSDRALSLYLSPTQKIPDSKFQIRNSNRPIHCEATRIIDLMQSDEDILSQMKPKGRYNIKVAQKNNVHIVHSEDTHAFYKLVEQTGSRDGFTHLPLHTYQAFVTNLKDSFLLLAYSAENKPIAGLIGVIWNGIGIYYYGASSYEDRALMAPYLLQWEAMQYCKKRGAKKYDLLGIAPTGAVGNHPWKGISEFKEKFGGEVREYPLEQEILLKPLIKKALSIKRKLLG